MTDERGITRCRDCRRKPLKGRARCSRCQGMNRKRKARCYARRRQQGLCARCNEFAVPGKRECVRHLLGLPKRPQDGWP